MSEPEHISSILARVLKVLAKNSLMSRGVNDFGQPGTRVAGCPLPVTRGQVLDARMGKVIPEKP